MMAGAMPVRLGPAGRATNKDNNTIKSNEELIAMIAAKHILGTFDEALAALRNNVLMMAGLTERSLERAMKGLFERDDNICAHAIADDEEIDQLEKQIDKDGVDILLRFQPVASDLRRVVSAMKLSSNLERMADQATTIARRARKLNQHPPLPEVDLMKAMYEQAMSMFKDSVDAFVREDVELGRAIVPRDEKLDDLNRMASHKLVERMAQDPDQLRGYLNLIFVGRCLERVGDHATNIAEDAVYAAAAEDIRHQSLAAAT
jgi:phosphate transport system protein